MKLFRRKQSRNEDHLDGIELRLPFNGAAAAVEARHRVQRGQRAETEEAVLVRRALTRRLQFDRHRIEAQLRLQQFAWPPSTPQ